jgi:cytochrome P450
MLRDAIPFGLGSRACIARNLATVELYIAVDAIVRDGLLGEAKPCKSKIEILEWFNSKVVGEKIEVRW